MASGVLTSRSLMVAGKFVIFGVLSLMSDRCTTTST